MELKFCAKILQNENMDAAYVEVPYDIKELFGKGRLLVNATFDGIPYRGQVVKWELRVTLSALQNRYARRLARVLVIWLKWFFMKETVRKAQCGNVPSVAESLRKKGKVITVVKSQRRLMNIS